MTNHIGSEVITIRYVYMIQVDNRGVRSRFYGLTSIFYTGSTVDLPRRLTQHIERINSSFLNKNFPDAQKKLVYVKTILGTENDAGRDEWILKKKNKRQKLELIKSEENDLVSYIPLKAIILKKYNQRDENIALRMI